MSENLRIWSALEKTDPKHTKAFKRAGGFTGTAIKPIWSIKRLTELFGPCGEGWGMTAPVFQTVPGSNGELLVYCTVGMWHGKPDSLVYGVGGDKVVTYIKANEQYKRPERWESDDEAFKKAFTDALMNAAKQIGVGADVHMGMFDDSKYVRQVEREFAEAENGGAASSAQSASSGPASPPAPPPPPKPEPESDPFSIYRIPVTPGKDGAADWAAWVPKFGAEIRRALAKDVILAIQEANADALADLATSGAGGEKTHAALMAAIAARITSLGRDGRNVLDAA